MPIAYHVYANDGRGGPVDYDRPIATTAGLTYQGPPLPPSSDTTLAVRAFDIATGVEEANTDARARFVIDAAGNDATAAPNGVLGLAAWPVPGPACHVGWSYRAAGQGGPPDHFEVTLSVPGSSPPAAPTATVAFLPGTVGYGCTLMAPPGTGPAIVGVRAVGPLPWLVGPVSTASLPAPTALADVDALAAVAMP